MSELHAPCQCVRSFGSSKASTAALVISLFPRFPVAPTDNRWHLQVCAHTHHRSACEQHLDHMFS